MVRAIVVIGVRVRPYVSRHHEWQRCMNRNPVRQPVLHMPDQRLCVPGLSWISLGAGAVQLRGRVDRLKRGADCAVPCCGDEGLAGRWAVQEARAAQLPPRSRANSRRVTLRPPRRCFFAFQFQFHRLVDGMAVVPGPAWHFDDDGEVLERFVAIGFGLLFRHGCAPAATR